GSAAFVARNLRVHVEPTNVGTGGMVPIRRGRVNNGWVSGAGTRPRHAERIRRRRHSTLMPAARITLPHFNVSSATKAFDCATESTIGSAPSATSRDLIGGSVRTALMARLR